MRKISKWRGSDIEKFPLPNKTYSPATGSKSVPSKPFAGHQRPPSRRSKEAALGPSPRIRLEGVNALLKDLYTESVLLSGILAEAGYSALQINDLKRQHVGFVAHLTERWIRILHRILGAPSFLVIRYFGIDGLPPRRGGGSVMSIQDKMSVLRRRKDEFRSAVLAAAVKFLGQAGD